MKKCPRCGHYTLNPKVCPTCEDAVVSAHPHRFSVEDRYGKYRRAMKKTLETQQDHVSGNKTNT